MRVVDGREVLRYGEAEPDCRNHQKRIEVKGHHAEGLKFEPREIIPSYCKEKWQKVKGSNRDEYPLRDKKSNISIFGWVFFDAVMDLLDFWHIFI